MSKRLLIVGCGYVGRVLAAHQREEEGWQVTTWTRTPESAAALAAQGFATHHGDASQADAWRGLSRDWDAIVVCAAGTGGEVDGYRRVYLDTLRRTVEHMTPGTPLVFTSSTSVYEQNDGEWLDENAPAPGHAPTTRILREAEDACLGAGGTVLRLAGIYGPGRTWALRAWDRPDFTLDGDGSRWMNMIYRDDIVSAIDHVLLTDNTGVFNVCDDEPVQQRVFYRWLAAQTGHPEPRPGPDPDASRKRGLTSKRVSNERLQSTGWIAAYSTFREGYTHLLHQEKEAAG